MAVGRLARSPSPRPSLHTHNTGRSAPAWRRWEPDRRSAPVASEHPSIGPRGHRSHRCYRVPAWFPKPRCRRASREKHSSPHGPAFRPTSFGKQTNEASGAAWRNSARGSFMPTGAAILPKSHDQGLHELNDRHAAPAWRPTGVAAEGGQLPNRKFRKFQQCPKDSSEAIE